ncbi:hypothetical protein BDW69DRAFT_179489 [Aspergillus filifer]
MEWGADVNLKHNSDDNPLHIAVRSGWTTAVQILLKNGADAMIEDTGGRTRAVYG